MPRSGEKGDDVKINGSVPDRQYVRAFALARPDGGEWVLKLSPLPLGFQRRLGERGIVSPAVPSRVARDSRGGLLKDRDGNAVTIADPHDAAYLRERERYQQHLAALTIWEALRNDADVAFDAQPPESGPWTEFAEQLCSELEEAGWSLGDVSVVCEEVFRLSNLLDEHLREAEQTFSSPAPPPETPKLRVHDPSAT